MLDKHFEQRNYFIFAAIFVVISFVIMKSFLFGILWGLIIALSLWPIFEFASYKKRGFIRQGVPNNAFTFTLIFSIVFLLPLLYSISEISGIYTAVSNYIFKNTSGGILHHPLWFEKLPMSNKIIKFWNDNVATSQGLLNFVSQINTEKILVIISAIWGQLLDKIITIVVMLITLYFMIKNGSSIKEKYQPVCSYWLSSKSTNYINNGIDAVRGTINGVLLVGIIEGILLAIPLVAGGIEAGFLIALIAGISGVIPMLMPALILPCLAYLFFTGDTLWSIIGLIDLVIVWFIFENIIKPQIIGKKVKVNTFLILASMIGGMQVLGAVGLFIGPAIIAMAIGMMKELIIVTEKNQD